MYENVEKSDNIFEYKIIKTHDLGFHIANLNVS